MPSWHYFLSLCMFPSCLTSPTITYFISDAPHCVAPFCTVSARIIDALLYDIYTTRTFLFVLSTSFLHTRFMSLCPAVAHIPLHLLYDNLLYITKYNCIFS